MNTQYLEHPLVLFTRPHADTETEKSDPATARVLVRNTGSRNLDGARKRYYVLYALLCPFATGE